LKNYNYTVMALMLVACGSRRAGTLDLHANANMQSIEPSTQKATTLSQIIDGDWIVDRQQWMNGGTSDEPRIGILKIDGDAYEFIKTDGVNFTANEQMFVAFIAAAKGQLVIRYRDGYGPESNLDKFAATTDRTPLGVGLSFLASKVSTFDYFIKVDLVSNQAIFAPAFSATLHNDPVTIHRTFRR
jgi:hypothetical protein